MMGMYYGEYSWSETTAMAQHLHAEDARRRAEEVMDSQRRASATNEKTYGEYGEVLALPKPEES